MNNKNLAEYQIMPYSYHEEREEIYAGITFLFVLQGHININSYGISGTFSKNHLLLINRNSPYRITGESGNIVIKLQISNHYFTRYYRHYFQYKYVINTEHYPQYKRQALEQLKWLIAKTMMIKIQGNDEVYLEANLLISDIMLKLVSYFQEDNRSDYPSIARYSHRMERITQQIEANYHTDLSLSELAEKEHLSVPYLSRLFKNEMGLGFSQYLTQVRFRHAVYELINTNKPIYRLIEDHGFADHKSFTQLFKKQYHTTPSQFRNQHRRETTPKLPSYQEHTSEKTEVDTATLLPLLANIINSTEKVEAREEYTHVESQIINIDQQRISESLPNQNYVIFIGDILELLKENIRKQLLHLKQHTPIQYVEVSHLISGTIIAPDIITDEDYPTYSSYINTDIAISFLADHQMSLVSRIYHERVLLDIAGYCKKISQFIYYAICTYGLEYVSTWRFVYYTDNTIEDIPLYLTTFHQIKQVIHNILPKAHVGLFYTYVTLEELQQLTQYPQQLSRIDFFAFRANFHDLIEITDANYEILQREISYIEDKTKELKQQLKRLNIEVPLYLMEWNTLTGNTRKTNGSYFRGALIFQTLMGVNRNVAAIGITLNTETQCEISTNYTINVNAIALYYIHLMPRPIFFVLKFLHQLQGKIIARGEDFLITEYSDGYYIALLNPSIFNPYLSIEEHMTSSFKQKKIITIEGLQSGHYQVKHYIFDQKHGALYHEYSRFKTRFGYDHEVIENLQTTAPELSVYDEIVENGEFTVLSDFDVNAIHFYKLHRMPAILEGFGDHSPYYFNPQ